MKLKYSIFVLFISICLVTCDDEASEQKTEKQQYVRRVPDAPTFFIETFETNIIGSKWIKSKAKKDGVEDTIAKYDGEWSIESSSDSVLEGDKGLVLKSKAKHHAIAAKLEKPFLFTEDKPLVVQYEVKFQNALECGGAYVKLVEDKSDFKLENFFDKTSFSIMFGPDKCGTETKFHFIVRFKNPVTGKVEEHHAKKSELPDAIFSDGKTHLYTLIVRPDNTFQMLIDRVEVNSGSLMKDLNPPINPPKEIVDPEDKKPESWDDREKIPDPDAVKPDDWDENEPKTIVDPDAKMPDGWLEDESETVADPSAVKPEDWDESTDGEWEAPKVDNPKCKSAPGCGKWSPPSVPNPKYKGKWKAPMIENPNYQGQWEPRKISNPEYFEDNDPYRSLKPFVAVGLELWSMTDNIYFDNFIVADDEKVAEKFAEENWVVKNKLELANSPSGDSVVDGLLKAANDKPWLWAVYLLVVLLPIVIITVFCCGKSSPAKVENPKKTDAVQPDDAQNAQDDQQNDGLDENTELIGKEGLEEVDAEEQDEEEEGEAVVKEKEQVEEPSETAKKSPSRRKARRE